jgi:serine phosphatase RsbU (regulator of sigma subunit)
MLIRRALAAWRQSDQLRVEFAAAREVQQRLVPIALPHIDRVRLSAAYLPAAEVGGDFYQVFPQSEGAALIVIGDVSGKGLKAAMTGTLVLGALHSLAQENLSPPQILSRLNVQLAASSGGGFVTCLCVRIAPDGTLTLANAGHLAPYRNGEEVPLDSGLPLGIAADATYPESTLQLAPTDRLTFLSDGVVEAQSATGELFGFDRTRSISTQTAEAIAHAAQAFGQQDDITVLTLTVAPAEVLHA